MRFLRSAWYLLLLISFGNTVIGTEPGLPSLTRQTIAGAWEALVGEWSVFRLEVSTNGESFLAEVSSTDKGMQTIYRAETFSVDSGHLNMRLSRLTKDSARPKVVVLRGKGFGDNELGRLDLQFTYLDRNGNASGKLKVTFLKPANRFNALAIFSKEAEKLIRESKKH
jgi:hypothetical protein